MPSLKQLCIFCGLETGTDLGPDLGALMATWLGSSMKGLARGPTLDETHHTPWETNPVFPWANPTHSQPSHLVAMQKTLVDDCYFFSLDIKHKSQQVLPK